MAELVELFTVERVNSSPAKFDLKKLEAINGDKIRALKLDEFLERSLPFLLDAKVITGSADEIKVVKSALPIIQERIINLAEIPQMLNFLFVKDFTVSPQELPKILDDASQQVLKVALAKVELLTTWDHLSIESVLRKALIDDLGLKPRIAFSALRIAVTGSHISPPLFESLELLGKERSIARIKVVISK
jgi:glutamyl-tRNA synthetase